MIASIADVGWPNLGWSIFNGTRTASTSKPPVPTSGAFWAIRRDWIDGVHEFIRLVNDHESALRELNGDRAYWRRGPMRPALSVVEISAPDFRLHARNRLGCKAPDCPRQALAPFMAGTA